MGLSIRTKNILTAVIALVLVGGFIFLAEGRKKDNKDDRLEAIENLTTTTVRRTTTSQRVTTTSTTALATTSTSSPPAVTTATTVRTTTTKPPAPPVTRRPAATTTTRARPQPPQNGEADERSDNTGTFTRSATGGISGNTPPACAASEPLCISLGANQGDNGQVRLRVQLRNNTNRTVTFLHTNDQGQRVQGLKISVVVQLPSGGSVPFLLDASGEKTLAPAGQRGDYVEVLAQTTFNEVGDYQFTAAVRVDWGS